MTNYREVYSVFKRANSKRANANGQSRIRTRSGVDYGSLEDRKMLAGVASAVATATLDPITSVLRIEGTTGDDQVFVSTPNDTEVRVTVNGQFQSFLQTSVTQIEFHGFAGNDTFNGDLSSIDVIASGGAGNDTLRGGAGEDILRGDNGDDLVSGGADDDTLIGGDGNDVLIGEAGNDTLIGGFGNDLLAGGDGEDGLFGGNGEDRLLGQNGEDRLNGNGGDDEVNGGAGADVVLGGNDNDKVSGGADGDRVFGNAGDDVVEGNSGDDLLFGGEGIDVINGGTGEDTLVGGNGDDTLNGGSGIDLGFGGNGFDTIIGGAGNDLLFGQAGADSIFGGLGNDRVVGGGGNDFLDGQDGNDFIGGGFGADRLFGGNGIDDLRGGFGADGLFGGVGGVDRLAGDEGSDRLISFGRENIVNLTTEDSQVVFRNGSGNWTNREIQVLDTGLHLMQRRLGNNRLSSDPVLDQPIVFVKENTLPPRISIGVTQVVDSERQYLFADWDEFDFESNQAHTAEVPRVVSLAWASSEAVGAVLPNLEQSFNRFSNISGWQSEFGGDFFRASEDGQFFYRQDAVFADETGRINPTQDWASAWQFFFSPPEVVEPVIEEPTTMLPGEPTFLTGDRVTINSFLEVGTTQRLTNFEFIVEESGPVTILTGIEGNTGTDSDFDTEIFVFQRNDNGTLGTLLAQNDDVVGSLDSLVSLTLPVGEYALVVGDFPISEFEARSGFGTGSGGQFQVTFIGTDGVRSLPSGPIGADVTTGTPTTVAPPELNLSEDPVFAAKLRVLDRLFTGLEVF